MQPNALQFNSIDITRLDNATLLSYMHQVYDHGQADATMQAKMGQWWTGFGAAYLLFDQVINPSRKSLETEDSPRVKAGGLRLGPPGFSRGGYGLSCGLAQGGSLLACRGAPGVGRCR